VLLQETFAGIWIDSVGAFEEDGMIELRSVVLSLLAGGLLLIGGPLVLAQGSKSQFGVKPSGSDDDFTGLDSVYKNSTPDRVNAVIYPVQSATIGSEVRGILQAVNHREGQAVKQGEVLAEVSKPRYEAIVGEFRGNYVSIKESLERSREDLKTQEETYGNRASTYQQLIRAKYEVRVMEGKLEEAEHKLRQAELNLEACVLKAPFSGLIAVLYRDSHETVDYLEKVMEIVDTKKVYARVNWPEARLAELSIGSKVRFQREGKTYEGVVEKMSSLIDPGSKSKRIHILIDNPDQALQVGMSGTVTPDAATKKSSLSESGGIGNP
jgi:RND family efflux transporter MFP subunit